MLGQYFLINHCPGITIGIANIFENFPAIFWVVLSHLPQKAGTFDGEMDDGFTTGSGNRLVHNHTPKRIPALNVRAAADRISLASKGNITSKTTSVRRFTADLVHRLDLVFDRAANQFADVGV